MQIVLLTIGVINVFLLGFVYYKFAKEIKNIFEEIIRISENLNILKDENINLQNLIENKSQKILDKIDEIKLGEIKLEGGRIEGDLIVEGSVSVNGNVSAFVEEGDE